MKIATRRSTVRSASERRLWLQSKVAPERLVPRIFRRSATELQEIEARPPVLLRLFSHAEVSGSSGGELDCERNAVKLAADLGDHRGIVVVE